MNQLKIGHLVIWAAGIAITSALLTWVIIRTGPADPFPMEAFSLNFEHDVIETTLAPDGTVLVYTAVTEGKALLFARRLDERHVTALEGTQNATQPFFSPDGNRVGFFADGYLKWTSLSGGNPLIVAPVGENTAGGSWGPDNRIVFASLDGQGLQIVAVSDETSMAAPMPLTALDEHDGEISHGWPHVLPDGRSVVFTVGRTGRDPRLAWVSLPSDKDIVDIINKQSRRILLAPADGGGFFLKTGHLLYSRRGEAFVVPVDVERRAITAPPRPVVDGVHSSSVGYGNLGRSSLVAALDGRMIYTEEPVTPNNMLVWVDRQGALIEVNKVTDQHQSPRLSPDGSLIAMTIRHGSFNRDLWLEDIQTGKRSQLTYEGDNHSPLWSSDGTHITFASNRDGPQRIYRIMIAEPSIVETLIFGDGRTPGSWTRDGRSLFFHESYPDRGRDIWVWTTNKSKSGQGTLLIASEANERTPAISPDGRWLAYVSDTEGGDQVYLRRYPSNIGTQVSVSGGTEPVWAQNSSELFYRRGRDLFGVQIAADSDEPAQAVHLFAGNFLSDPDGSIRSYDVNADSTRFIMLRPVGRASTLQVLSRWQAVILTGEP